MEFLKRIKYETAKSGIGKVLENLPKQIEEFDLILVRSSDTRLLNSFKNLSTLSLSVRFYGYLDITGIINHKKLKYISFNNFTSRNLIGILSTLDLRTLNLKNCLSENEDLSQVSLKKWDHLYSYSIYRCVNCSILYCSDLDKLVRLKHFYFSNARSLENTSKLKNFKNLYSISLINIHNFDSDLLSLMLLNKLQKLEFSYSKITKLNFFTTPNHITEFTYRYFEYINKEKININYILASFYNLKKLELDMRYYNYGDINYFSKRTRNVFSNIEELTIFKNSNTHINFSYLNLLNLRKVYFKGFRTREFIDFIIRTINLKEISFEPFSYLYLDDNQKIDWDYIDRFITSYNPASRRYVDHYITLNIRRASKEEFKRFFSTIPTKRKTKMDIEQETLGSDQGIYFQRNNGPYFEFSNFYVPEIAIKIDNEEWISTEHYYQASKYFHKKKSSKKYKKLIKKIKNASTPREAKAVAYDTDLEIENEWNVKKYEVMLKAVRAKFSQNKKLKSLLMATGNRRIIEHSCKDLYWGNGCNDKGMNFLGRILMQVRTELYDDYKIKKGKTKKWKGTYPSINVEDFNKRKMQKFSKYILKQTPKYPNVLQFKPHKQIPFEHSTWVFENLLVGAIPQGYDYKTTRRMLFGLKNAGITHVISLIEDKVNEKLPFVYYDTYKKIDPTVTIMKFPIPDMEVENDENVLKGVNKVIKLLLKKDIKIYIHCKGGHGRTGTFLALILGRIFNINADDALAYTQALHQRRYKNADVNIKIPHRYLSPQTDSQYKQVRRLLE